MGIKELVGNLFMDTKQEMRWLTKKHFLRDIRI